MCKCIVFVSGLHSVTLENHCLKYSILKRGPFLMPLSGGHLALLLLFPTENIPGLSSAPRAALSRFRRNEPKCLEAKGPTNCPGA